jgi:hypothetical protein
MGAAPITSTLAMLHSTAELIPLIFWSGESGTIRQPEVWKTSALPIELPPHYYILRY